MINELPGPIWTAERGTLYVGSFYSIYKNLEGKPQRVELDCYLEPGNMVYLVFSNKPDTFLIHFVDMVKSVHLMEEHRDACALILEKFDLLFVPRSPQGEEDE